MNHLLDSKSPRLAARAIILHEDRLLLVNAYPAGLSDLWCTPGGGVERGNSLHDSLIREIYEETGLSITVGTPALVNEFHDPSRDFHQVDIYFRCHITSGSLDMKWRDPEGIVSCRKFFTRADMSDIRFKPDSLVDVAWSTGNAISYDPIELIVR